MQAVLSVLLPIFGLILAGFAAGRLGWLGDGATNSLNRFVVRLALPAELFQSMAQITPGQIGHPGFIVCYAVAMLATFAIGLWLDLRRPVQRENRFSGAVIEGLASGYANTAFMGIPLCLGVFGQDGLPPVILASILTVCALFALGIALVELDLQSGQSTGRTLLNVGTALIRNPLVAAPLAGAAVNLAGIPLGAPVLRFTGLLGDAASPCALVTIGLFLAEPVQGSAPLAALARVVGLKLLFQPALTALLALFVFDLPSLWARSAILISALPVGTGPFMLARLYEREPGVASRATLISTILSLVTVSFLLSWMA